MLGMQQQHNPNKHFEMPQPPTDTVSALAWSPKANFIAASSWSNDVRIWEVSSDGNQAQAKAAYNHDAPVLCTTWSGDGSRVFSGGADNQAKMFQPGGQAVQIAQHDAPIRHMAWVDDLNALATASWDKTIAYWDTRQQSPAMRVPLPERCYAMDVSSPLMVVGTADRQVVVFDLRNPGKEFKRIPSPLKHQTRCISCFPDKSGFAIGSIEGRVGIHFIEDRESNKNFAFKCHRDGTDVYAVNCIVFHQQFGTFVTAGSDGSFHFWDKDSKQRLKQFPRANMPITACGFNANGELFAYAEGYDWSKGHEHFNPNAMKPCILLYKVQANDVKSKQQGAAQGRKK